MSLLSTTLLLTLIDLTYCQEYIVPVFVRADQFGTDYFKVTQPKSGPPKSTFHIEQLIKLEGELLGLSEIILQTEEKLHAKKKLQKDESKDETVYEGEKHEHNYSLEKSFIQEIWDENERALQNLKKYTNNPLAMFSIRKRLADKWPYILDNITSCSMVADHAAINDHFQQVDKRLKADVSLDLVYEDLLRLQKTYKLSVASMARGWLLDEVTEPLSLTDIITIANICLDREDLEGTLEWLLQIAKLLKHMGLIWTQKVKYMNILGGAYLRLNRLQEAKLVYGQLLKEDSENRVAKANMQLITARMKEDAVKEKKAKEKAEEDAKKKVGKTGKLSKKKDDKKDKEKDKDEYEDPWWMKYCRGDYVPDYEKERLLKCYVKEIPISKQRYQVEPLSVNPPIYIIKNVLENFTMSKMVEYATEQLSEKILSYSQPDDTNVPIYLNDKNYWMEKFAFTMRNLTYQKYRVDTHKDLNLLGAVRVYNLGAGGTSNPGRGEIRVNPRSGWEKNFIGRYMSFLSVPKAGGYISFPWAKIRVKPERGDVLFWQFRTPWGYVHPKLYHWLECPVLLGDLWFAEQMVEHHDMIEKVDLLYDPNAWPLPTQTKDKPKIAKKKSPVKKKKILIKDDETEEKNNVEETAEEKTEDTPEEKEIEMVEAKNEIQEKQGQIQEEDKKEKNGKETEAKKLASKVKHETEIKESKGSEDSEDDKEKEKSQAPAKKKKKVKKVKKKVKKT